MAEKTVTEDAINRDDGYRYTHIPRPQKLKWSQEGVERRIQEKLREKSGHGTMSRIYHVFGGVDEELSPAVFRRLLGTQFGIRLSERESLHLFRKYDKEGAGVIELASLLQQLVPAPFSGKQFYISSQEKRDQLDSRLRRESHHLEDYPKSLEKFRWSLADLERMIQDKIVGFASSSQDQFRTTFCLFDRINAGIDRRQFQETIHKKFGLLLTPEEVDVLFKRYDKTGSGTVNFYHFFRDLMPKDFPRPTTWEGGSAPTRGKKQRDSQCKNNESQDRPHDWCNTFADTRTGEAAAKAARARRLKQQSMERQQQSRRHTDMDPTLRALPPSLQKFKWSLDRVEEVIRNKIRCRTLTSDQGGAEITSAFNLFADPASVQHSGISKRVFRETLALKFGIVLSEEEAAELHRRYDTEGKGVITYYDFAKAVMPPDFGAAHGTIATHPVLAKRLDSLDVRLQVHDKRQMHLREELAGLRHLTTTTSSKRTQAKKKSAASASSSSSSSASARPMRASQSLPAFNSLVGSPSSPSPLDITGRPPPVRSSGRREEGRSGRSDRSGRSGRSDRSGRSGRSDRSRTSIGRQQQQQQQQAEEQRQRARGGDVNRTQSLRSNTNRSGDSGRRVWREAQGGGDVSVRGSSMRSRDSVNSTPPRSRTQMHRRPSKQQHGDGYGRSPGSRVRLPSTTSTKNSSVRAGGAAGSIPRLQL